MPLDMWETIRKIEKGVGDGTKVTVSAGPESLLVRAVWPLVGNGCFNFLLRVPLHKLVEEPDRILNSFIIPRLRYVFLNRDEPGE